MASTIQLKTGTSGAPSSLTNGEVAINVNNGLFYFGSGSGNDVRQLDTFTDVTASSNISASGNLIGTLQNKGDGTSTGNITFDSAKGIHFVDSGQKIIGSANAITIEGDDYIIANADLDTTFNTPLVKVGGIISSSGNIITESNITASGNISASGTIFSSTEEILLFSSFKATTMDTVLHSFIPSQNGMNYYLMLDTNVNDISGSFVGSTTQANQHNGFMVPYKFLVTGIECQGRSSAGSNSNPVVFELRLHTGTPPDGTNSNTSYANVASLSASSGNVGQGGSGTKHRNSFTYTQGGEPFIVSQSQMLTPSLRRTDGGGISSTNGWISFTIKGHKIK